VAGFKPASHINYDFHASHDRGIAVSQPVLFTDPGPGCWVDIKATEALRGFDIRMGGFQIRKTAPGRAEARFGTGEAATNAMGGLHGGYLAAIAEMSLYLPLYVNQAVVQDGVVTIDFTLQYLIGGSSGEPIISDVELLRETGRMGFVRGVLRQGDTALVSFAGTLRKLPR
jgi:acyl-coenzyme A thioesterase PaaI-like protein